MFYSPLRYPGGKNKLSKFIEQICVDNKISGHYVEPYAGGASVALYLLLEKKVQKITINDFDKSLYAFWWSVLNKTEILCNLIENTDITIENWKKMKKIQQQKETTSLIELGFSTLFLNRTNRSGIINAGVIGGLDQKGNYKMDCRFNKLDIIRKIKLIAKHKKQIELYNLDAIDLIKNIKKESNNKNTILYFDPPYFLKGPGLYMNSYKKNDHKRVSEEIQKIKNIHWIVSYDNHSEIKDIYKWVGKRKTIEFNVQHSAYATRLGEEILFFSKNLQKINYSLIK